MKFSSAADLPFTPEAVAQMLTWGAYPDTSPYTHKQIAEWCDRFWCSYIELEPPPHIAPLLPVLADVEAQWDLRLQNTYPVEELIARDFENERMPTEWFKEWLQEIKCTRQP